MRTLLLGLLGTAALLVGCASSISNVPPARSSVTDDRPADLQARRAALLSQGESLFSRCQSCHGSDGRADTAFGRKFEVPDFSRMTWQRSRETAQLFEAIQKGSTRLTGNGAPLMPAQPDLEPEEVTALVVYVRSLGDK